MVTRGEQADELVEWAARYLLGWVPKSPGERSLPLFREEILKHLQSAEFRGAEEFRTTLKEILDGEEDD